jgi:EF-P beta-lysylation protein EpmB
MITRSVASVDSITWQEQVSQSIRDPKKLLEWLDLDKKTIESLLGGSLKANYNFKLKVPYAYLRRIKKGDPNDPLLRQILPSKEELYAAPGYTKDPLGENKTNLIPGLVHKYEGRILLIVSSNCAVNCRYCFRRSFPYQDNKLGMREWQQALEYINKNKTITEVIFSGGDPLSISDTQLLWLTEEIAKIPHVQRLRVHTRLPVVIPDRITEDCLLWLTSTRLLTSLVIHSNHPKELDDTVESALKNLSEAGVILLNQTVLLAGINDSINILQELSERLYQMKVLPYYLHQLDKVEGASHFEVRDEVAKKLLVGLTAKLPGYLVPKLVREIAGMPSKVPLS